MGIDPEELACAYLDKKDGGIKLEFFNLENNTTSDNHNADGWVVVGYVPVADLTTGFAGWAGVEEGESMQVIVPWGYLRDTSTEALTKAFNRFNHPLSGAIKFFTRISKVQKDKNYLVARV